MLIAHHDADDIVVGLLSALLAAWASLRLMQPDVLRPRALPTLRLAARIVAQALIAGIDVGLRALSPSMRLRPGFAHYRSALPDGPRLYAFATLMSLCPGTLPLGGDSGDVQLVHCLDHVQDVPEQMRQEEEGFRRAFPEL